MFFCLFFFIWMKWPWGIRSSEQPFLVNMALLVLHTRSGFPHTASTQVYIFPNSSTRFGQALIVTTVWFEGGEFGNRASDWPTDLTKGLRYCQWTANNQANNNINCFQHRKLVNNDGRHPLFGINLPVRLSKRLCTLNLTLDLGASDRKSITLQHTYDLRIRHPGTEIFRPE